jgi:hypothetical protein
MRIAFLYNEPSEDPAGLAEDSDPDRSPVVAALRQLDHEVIPMACSLNLAAIRRQLDRLQPSNPSAAATRSSPRSSCFWIR